MLSCAKKYLVESNQVGKLGNVGFKTTISTLVLTKRKYKVKKPVSELRIKDVWFRKRESPKSPGNENIHRLNEFSPL